MRKIALLTFVATMGAASPSYGQDRELQQKLKDQFSLTKVNADRSDIVEAGAVLVLQKGGMMMYSTASPVPPLNTYKNGKISQGWGGFGRDLKGTMLTPGNGTTSDYPQRRFVAGEKFWVTSIAVQKSAIVFQLLSDPFDDVRYYGDLKFTFDKGSISTPGEALTTIAEVLTIQPADINAQLEGAAGLYVMEKATGNRLRLNADGTLALIQDGRAHKGTFTIAGNDLTLRIGRAVSKSTLQGDTLLDPNGSTWVREARQTQAVEPPGPPGGTPGPPGGTPGVNGAPAAAAPQVIIAPPPPPPADAPAAPPESIAIGQTKTQVVASFGQPARIVRLAGGKEIYSYKDLKVIFVGGKVTDVQ